VYTVGAYGFFALPYTIVVYPFVFMFMPVLWKRAKDFGYVTAGDVVHGQYGSRGLELAVAATGVIAMKAIARGNSPCSQSAFSTAVMPTSWRA
ncbi:hypothetical protein ACC692_37060, partial [Rhizobium ruizarguesonis]